MLDLAGIVHAGSRAELPRQLGREIAAIDALLSRQVNAIIHHPRFQQLEAAWRSLRLLADQADPEEGVKVKLLSVTKKELRKDLDTAIEFDQSELFRKIYRDAFKMPGAEPFGVLIGDYEFSHHPEDVGMLAKISEVAAVSFCPFIAGAAPSLFGSKSFSALELPRNLGRLFEGVDYLEWQRLREQSESAFIGLTLPRILVRLPYGEGELREDGFDYREDVVSREADKHLWGNASYALAQVLMRAFVQTGWLAEIRGVIRGEDTGGIVNRLPLASFATDRPGLIAKCPTDLVVVDTQEKNLAELGVIPLCHCHGTEYGAFYGCPSLRQPPQFNDPLATMNARISAMLPYVLCASRFAHYLNALARDQVGSVTTAEALETRLNNWVHDYVLDDPNADPELKAEFPLRAAQCQVRERPGKPGSYDCILQLQPHYQLEAVTANVELKTLRIDQASDAIEGSF